MKILTRQFRNPPLRAALFSLVLMDVVRALDITLPTEADLQAVEYNNTPQNTGNGTGIQINARWADTVNEVIALRFNLTAYDRSQLSAASLNLIKGHADGIVTIIISAENSSTTQLRFAARETTVLQSGGAAQPAGTFAPKLVLTINDNSVDRDNDGLLNAWETSHGLNPDKSDSDGVLCSDPAELIRNSSPKLATSVPDGAVLTILGTGDGSLPGSDLSDPDNNIDDSNALRCRIRLAQRHGQRTGFF